MKKLLFIFAVLLASPALADAPFVAVVGWDGGNRVTKYHDFQTLGEAQAHVGQHGGFATTRPAVPVGDWLVDSGAGTLSIDVIPAVKPTVISFDDFEARFTTQEWDDATDYVYEVSTTTGKPKRRALVQGLARAQAKNHIDLLDAKTDTFLGVLVSGGVLTAARKTTILTP